MKQPAWIKQGIAVGNQFHYKKKNRVVHNLINLSVMALLLAGIVALMSTASVLSPAPFLLGVAPLMGVLFFALYILVIHEASHNMFVSVKAKDKSLFWNRLFGWSIAIPFSTNYIRHWEEGHTFHHLHPVEEGDRQTVNLLTGEAFVKRFLMMLFVPGYVFLWNPSRQYKTQRWLPAANAAFWVATIGLTVALLPWWSAIAYLIAIQVVGALNQLKGSLEHGGPIGYEENPFLRSRTSLFPFRWLLLPMNISLHFEHHLNFSVPWYELVRYHRALKPLVPEEVRTLIFNERCMDQVLGRIGAIPDELRPAIGA